MAREELPAFPLAKQTKLCRITMNVLMAAVLPAQLRYGQESKEVDLRRAFDKLDTKKDGKIDVEELLGFFRSRGDTMTRVWCSHATLEPECAQAQ